MQQIGMTLEMHEANLLKEAEGNQEILKDQLIQQKQRTDDIIMISIIIIVGFVFMFLLKK
jgi:hypothetical protein